MRCVDLAVLDPSKPVESNMSAEDIQSLVRELEEVYNALLREKDKKTEEDMNLIGELYTLIVRLKKTLKLKAEAPK
ncbi:MAG: hypothetical protein KIH01_06905 [Candidatus Freyarchaeota archaeon]|nr:hypothetical protein [Candidatus Jordarchaeia archaeon]